MTTIPLDALTPQLASLVRRVEQGETIVVTRDGTPILDLVPHPRAGGLDLEAGSAFLRGRGIANPFPFVAPDFDAPLPPQVLLEPLP